MIDKQRERQKGENKESQIDRKRKKGGESEVRRRRVCWR